MSAKYGLVALAFVFLALAAQSSAARGRAGAVSTAALAAAGKRTTLQSIDYDEVHCEGERTVDAWLRSLAGRNARNVQWSGGACQLAGDLETSDSSDAWCAQATVRLARPLAKDDAPMVEIYFDQPRRGRPGRAFAFRGAIKTREGWDITRYRRDFEAEWVDRFGPSPAICRDGAYPHPYPRP